MKGGRAGLQSSLCFWRLMTQLAALGCISDILQTSSPESLPSTFCSLELIQCISDYYVMRQRGRGGWEGPRGEGGARGQAGRGLSGFWSCGAGSGICHSKYSCVLKRIYQGAYLHLCSGPKVRVQRVPVSRQYYLQES